MIDFASLIPGIFNEPNYVKNDGGHFSNKISINIITAITGRC